MKGKSGQQPRVAAFQLKVNNKPPTQKQPQLRFVSIGALPQQVAVAPQQVRVMRAPLTNMHSLDNALSHDLLHAPAVSSSAGAHAMYMYSPATGKLVSIPTGTILLRAQLPAAPMSTVPTRVQPMLNTMTSAPPSAPPIPAPLIPAPPSAPPMPVPPSAPPMPALPSAPPMHSLLSNQPMSASHIVTQLNVLPVATPSASPVPTSSLSVPSIPVPTGIQSTPASAPPILSQQSVLPVNPPSAQPMYNQQSVLPVTPSSPQPMYNQQSVLPVTPPSAQPMYTQQSVLPVTPPSAQPMYNQQSVLPVTPPSPQPMYNQPGAPPMYTQPSAPPMYTLPKFTPPGAPPKFTPPGAPPKFTPPDARPDTPVRLALPTAQQASQAQHSMQATAVSASGHPMPVCILSVEQFVTLQNLRNAQQQLTPRVSVPANLRPMLVTRQATPQQPSAPAQHVAETEAAQPTAADPAAKARATLAAKLLHCPACRDFASLHPDEGVEPRAPAGGAVQVSEEAAEGDLLSCERCQATVRVSDRLASHPDLPRTLAGLRSLFKGRYSSGPTKQPHQMIKVHDIDDLSPGCQVAFRRQLGYYHHAIVTDVHAESFETVEYDFRLRGNGLVKVLEQTRQLSSELPCLYRVDYHNLDCYLPDTVVRRARRRLDESQYSIIKSNCEHLAVWAKTGTSESFQMRDLERRLGSVDQGDESQPIRVVDPEAEEVGTEKDNYGRPIQL